jgi:site-specific recombinase XerC
LKISEVVKSVLNVTHEFQKPIHFTDINRRWLDNYYRFLSERGNCHNAIVIKMRFLKKFCSMAIKEGMIRNNPFEGYKVKEHDTIPVYCTPVELETLETYFLKMKPDHKKEILRRFLFFSFSGGLRLSD